MAYPEFMEICDTANVTIPATNLSPQRSLWTTNHLLSTWRVVGYRNKEAHGIKTGSTDAAGLCLISSAQRGELHFLSVILGAERIEENGVGNLLSFSETTRLFNYGFDHFSYRTILESKEVTGEVSVTLSKTDYVTVHPSEDVEVLFPRDLNPEDLERVITLPETVEAPIAAGAKPGHHGAAPRRYGVCLRGSAGQQPGGGRPADGLCPQCGAVFSASRRADWAGGAGCADSAFADSPPDPRQPAPALRSGASRGYSSGYRGRRGR